MLLQIIVGADTFQAEVTREADERTFEFFEKWLETTDETQGFL